MKNTFFRHILRLSVICLFIFLLQFFRVFCPIRRLFGIPCPTCGVTRALLYLCEGRIRASLACHPLAIPLTLTVWLLLHKSLFKKKRPVFLLCAHNGFFEFSPLHL